MSVCVCLCLCVYVYIYVIHVGGCIAIWKLLLMRFTVDYLVIGYNWWQSHPRGVNQYRLRQNFSERSVNAEIVRTSSLHQAGRVKSESLFSGSLSIPPPVKTIIKIND